MKLVPLLRDATASASSASIRSMQIALAEKLNAAHPADPITAKGIAKWFERGTVPSKWLMRMAALPSKPLNLAAYA